MVMKILVTENKIMVVNVITIDKMNITNVIAIQKTTTVPIAKTDATAVFATFLDVFVVGNKKVVKFDYLHKAYKKKHPFGCFYFINFYQFLE